MAEILQCKPTSFSSNIALNLLVLSSIGKLTRILAAVVSLSAAELLLLLLSFFSGAESFDLYVHKKVAC